MNGLKPKYRYVKRFLLSLIGRDHFTRTDCVVDYSINEDYYGAWPIVHNFFKNPPNIYSFGVGDNITWDLDAISYYKTKVYAFDPTPVCNDWIKRQQLPEEFNFSKIGISDHNGEESFAAPTDDGHVSFKKNIFDDSMSFNFKVNTLDALMKKNNHHSIDILKMDIEGFEYNVIDDILNKSIFPSILLVEFHHRFNGFGIKKTINAINKLKLAQYSIFYVSNNGEEIGFIQKKLP